MTFAPTARGAGILMVGLALFDPACAWQRAVPLPVEVRAGSAEAADAQLAVHVRDAIARASPRLAPNSRLPARAVVLVGAPPRIDDLPDAVPVSIVTPSQPDRNTMLVDVVAPTRALVGQNATIEVVIEARGARALSSRIALEREGVELAAVDHRWTGDGEQFRARLSFAPPAAGLVPLRVVARPVEGEPTVADNHLDFALPVEDRRLRVLIVEPRPSWAAAFVRRALEADPLFEVAAVSRPSPGVQVRAGSAPARLTLDRLTPFEAIVVGAPEELRASEVDVLRQFAETRGGTVVLVPDRRPSGSYAAMVPVRRFDEVLLESPERVAGTIAGLRASELAVPIDPAPHVDVVATLSRQGRELPIVLAWPIGEGSALVSGALDAWRYRDRPNEFAKFWRTEIAQAALAAPPSLAIAIDPRTAAPGDAVEVRARFRRSELGEHGRPPAVRAELHGPAGTVESLRLWPAAAFGIFEARVEPRRTGLHVVRVMTGDRVAGEQAFAVRADARTAATEARASSRALADASGGTVARYDQIGELVRRLEALPSASEPVDVHPARSPWWMCTAVVLLALEWTVRRRRALP